MDFVSLSKAFPNREKADHGLLNTRPDMSHFKDHYQEASFQKT